MSEDVTYEVSDGVATLTLNRPERMNTISGPMLDELTRLLVRAGEDREARVIVLTGTGRAFCAGLDLNAAQKGEGIGSSSATFGATIDLRNTPPTVLHALDKPVIAALNGSAAGYGMDMALGCDIRVMAAEAKLAAAFVKRGILPESGGTWFLPRMLGWAKAAESKGRLPTTGFGDSGDEPMPAPMSAAYTGCLLTRRFAKAAFAKHKRSMTAPDLIEEIGGVFEEFCPAEPGSDSIDFIR